MSAIEAGAIEAGANVVADIDLVSRNMTAFAKWMPDIHATLLNHKPASQIVREDDGTYNVEFRGTKLYSESGPDLARQYVDNLKGNYQNRLRLSPLKSQNIDEHSAAFLYRLLKRSVDADVTFLENPGLSDSYHLIVFGLGLGYHLQELIEFAKPYSICIVEPELDFLYHSLSTMEWAPILELKKDWPFAVTIARDTTSEAMAHRARSHCRFANPASVDGTLVAQSYSNEIMTQARRALAAQAGLISMGLGFVADEMEMTRAAYFNLAATGDYRVMKRNKTLSNVPAFVVGSGPSIDDDIDFLRANQDKAVIFACGSSLGVLLKNGIHPDFELILENGEEPRKVLETVARSYDFGDLVLIGSNTISPQTKVLFKETIYYMRQALSSYAMFFAGTEYSLDDSGPLVSNTGLSAALAMGFRDIYLFGIDLGSANPNKHHSKHSPYKMEGADNEYAKGQEAIYLGGEYNVKALGNFGGIVHTDDVLAWGRDALEALMSRFKDGRRIFNCSGGVRINGARPQVSAGVTLTTTKEEKTKALRAAIEHCPKAETFNFAKIWAEGNWLARVHSYAQQVLDVIEARPERATELLFKMCPILIPDHYRLPKFEEFFLRGTLFVELIAADYYWRRVHGDEKREQFEEIMFEEITSSIKKILLQADWYFEHVKEMRTAPDLTQAISEMDK